GYYDRRCWARKVSMQTNKVVRVTLTVPSTADLDLYLYSGTPDSKGNPQILAYSCTAGTDSDESIEYLASSNATGYLVVKRVSGSGSWSLDGSVTAVELASLKAEQNAGAVRLDWRTGFEADNLGFNIYREANGVLTRLTPELIAGSALLAGAGTPLTAGAAYSWWDTLPLGASDVCYWLEDVDLNGTVKRHGPVRPAPSVEPLSPASAAALLAQVGRDSTRQSVRAAAVLADRASISSNIRPVVQALEPIVSPPATTVPLSLRETQWRLAAGRTAKITVRQEGWYRLGKRQLTALGFDPALNPRLLQLFCNGLEIPIVVTGEDDGRFDDNDTLEFYGLGADTLWSDAQTYWLTVGVQHGRRIPTVPNVAPTAAPLQHFPFTVERKDRTVYFAALKNGDASNFFGPTIAGQPVDQVLAVVGKAAVQTDAKLEVAVQGVTLGAHRVAVQLNGAAVGTIAFSGQMHGAARFAVPQSALREGDNVVTLISTGGTTDVSLVDAVRLTYARLYRAENNCLRMTVTAGKPVVVSGFTHSQIRVMDVTNPAGPVEIRGVVRPDPSQAARFSVEIVAPGMGRRTLLAFAPSAVKVPAALSPNVPSSWHAAGRRADMVIITPARFRAAVHPLQWLRRSQGMAVVVIDVADLYDEFNFGNKSAYALRDFLARARAVWAVPPRFVLLAGDASADPRDYYGLGDRDFVPTKLVDTAVMETACDDWFADFNGDNVPEMAVGRLPVRSLEETAAAVAKILIYEQSPSADWTKQALLVADNNDTFDFEAASAEVGALLPGSLTVDGVFLGWTTLDLARAMLLEKLNSGRLLVNYIGHGSMDMWAGEGLLTSSDAAALTNGGKLPLVVSMTCLNGYLQDPRNDCLAKALMNARRGGAVAVWASSGMTGPSAQAELNKAFVRALFGPEPPTIGQAAMRAKRAVTLPDIRRTWILFGDPAMRLK
ncbi:MAG: C25 family cysteine peptidase, partial [Candidatus Sumerlaeia bacterium]|nr:C25 family cysteine peptidase [Candidatus Sumerlaeia bacterium]